MTGILDGLTDEHQRALDRAATAAGWSARPRDPYGPQLLTGDCDRISEAAGAAVLDRLHQWNDQRKAAAPAPARRRPTVLREIPLTRKTKPC